MVVFRHSNFDEFGCMKMFHFDLAWWIKAKWDEKVPHVMGLIRDLGCVEVPRKLLKIKNRGVWKPPTSGQIKVNIDGSFLDIAGSGSIEGVFRDPEGKVIFQFGKSVWANSAVHAKLLFM